MVPLKYSLEANRAVIHFHYVSAMQQYNSTINFSLLVMLQNSRKYFMCSARTENFEESGL